MISCAPHISCNEINDSVVQSERGGLVGGPDPPLAYSAHTTAGDVGRTPTSPASICSLCLLFFTAGVHIVIIVRAQHLCVVAAVLYL